MPTLPYHVVDVFTDRPYAGNPLAVVLGADDLPTEALQAMAREFNLSETAFPMATRAEADYRVRIFTAGKELPFAGHPSIGTAWLLARLGRIPTGPVRQDCAAGILPIVVTPEGATLTGGPATASGPLDAGPLLAAVGLDAGDLSGVPARSASAGLEWTYLPVADEAVARAVVDFAAVGRSTSTEGIAVVSWDGDTGRAHLRAFTEDVEDPATGSAALGFGAFLAASGLAGDGSTEYEISQGGEVGRPSTLSGTVTTSGATITRVTVRGGVAPVATGEITPPTWA